MTEQGTKGVVLQDSLGRVASKLRISVTDRCNFRCNFCMPEDPSWLPRKEILSFEEITRVTRVLASIGIHKIRLSGGEPLMRRGVEKLVNMLVQVPGIEDVSMTTNGIMLADRISLLKRSGLNGVTVSLHSMKAERFESITGTRNTFERVLQGIQSAKDAGLKVKINTVTIRDCNEDEILDFANLAYYGNVTVRFIEYMPFDGKKLWGMEKVFSGKSIIDRISTKFSLTKCLREPGSTAETYSFAEGSTGEISIITSMTKPFCADCDRVRLKADGKLVPCLFSSDEYDLRPLLRRSGSDQELSKFICESYLKKSPGIETILKEKRLVQHIRPMHTIGG